MQLLEIISIAVEVVAKRISKKKRNLKLDNYLKRKYKYKKKIKSTIILKSNFLEKILIISILHCPSELRREANAQRVKKQKQKMPPTHKG